MYWFAFFPYDDDLNIFFKRVYTLREIKDKRYKRAFKDLKDLKEI